MLRRTLISACAVLVFSTAALGQVKLENRFLEGTYTTEVTSRIEQTLTIAGMENQTSADTRAKTQSTVGKRDVGGLVRVQAKPESMQISMRMMGIEYNFDSAAPDNKGGSQLEVLRDVHKALMQRSTTTVLDKDNNIVSIESDRDVLSGLPPELARMAKSQLDPEYLKKAAKQEMDKLPSEPVNKGDSWQRSESANFGGGQVMTFQTNYTYEGTVEKEGKTLDKITSKVTAVDFALEPDSPLPLKLKGSQLKAAESDGVVLFDRERGQAVEQAGMIRITGDITFEFNGMELPSTLDLKMESSAVTKRQ
jgi:hypothetical protein